ncbi:MAG TPA: heme exporter protein CcmB [Actinomycetota bacterium]|nr:heme exporter protein CcmB [Actinomycetota bacterium]
MTLAVAEKSLGFTGKTLLLVRKDLAVEARGRETLPGMLAFAFTVTLLLAFTLPPGAAVGSAVRLGQGSVAVTEVLSGFLWVTILFAGLIGFARAFEVERTEGALEPLFLAPVDRSALFASKAASNLVTLAVVEVFLVPAFALLFSIDLGGGRWLGVVAVVLLVDIGFVMVGTLFSALAAQTRSREVMLPILALPVLVPIFIAATELTADVFAGGGLGTVAARGWFGILVASDVVFAVIGALAFEFAVDR